MLLHAYVDPVPIGAFGRPPLSVGVDLSLALVGNPGSTVGSTVRGLDCYMADDGQRTLKRTGLAEYAFSGRILEVRGREVPNGLTYTEALLDCGVPLIFAAYRGPGIAPHDLVDPTNQDLGKRHYLSGLMLLSAHIVWAFRDPPLIKHELRVRVASITEVELSPSAKILGGLIARQSIDSQDAVLPVVLGLEI